MENAARNIGLAPEVQDFFKTIEDAFEKLSHRGFKCHAVLANEHQGGVYKVTRDPDGPGNGLTRKIFDGVGYLKGVPQEGLSLATGPVVAVNESAFEESVAVIEDAAENIRSLSFAIGELARPSEASEIFTLAKLCGIEADGLVKIVQKLYESKV